MICSCLHWHNILFTAEKNVDKLWHVTPWCRSLHDQKLIDFIELTTSSSSSVSIVSDYILDNRGSIPGRRNGFFPLASVYRPTLRPTQPPIQWVPGFDPRQRQRIFPLAYVSRPAQRPTQAPIQWVLGLFPGDKARQGRDADHSTHLVPRSRIGRSFSFSPWHLHGVAVQLYFFYVSHILKLASQKATLDPSLSLEHTLKFILITD
jgi:hypothetical protein